jgi:adenylosuccinate lyase
MIHSISPLDGRYHNKTKELQNIFSEYAFMRYRLYVEIEYFLYITQIVNDIQYTETEIESILNIYKTYDDNAYQKIKDFEKITNHDVKAVEYYFKDKLEKIQLGKYKEFIHFGLTSQDINSICYIIQIRNYIVDLFIPTMHSIIDQLKDIANANTKTVMLSRTHGQVASPTTIGKEFLVFIHKLTFHLDELIQVKYYSKFGGAVGNMNAHYAAYPDVNWEDEFDQFTKLFDIKRHKYTTQIDNYDFYSILFDHIKRIQNVLIDFSQDIWYYISIDYFKLKRKEGEIGSSTMPHKVNPIDFENSEGNLQISNVLLEFLSGKLPKSRLQRDLTDSTILRNLGVSFGYGMVALKSLSKGVGKLEVSREKIKKDLEMNWIVIMEAIQTVLRRENMENAYEITKQFIEENPNPSKHKIHQFIDTLNTTNKVKSELKEITPQTYIGFLSK